MSWREFSLYIEGYGRRIEDEWKRTREIIAMQYNTHVQKRGQQKKSSDILRLPSDDIVIQPTSNLQDFKALCKKWGIPWNPVKN